MGPVWASGGFPAASGTGGGTPEEAATAHATSMEEHHLTPATAGALCGLGHGLVHGAAFGYHVPTSQTDAWALWDWRNLLFQVRDSLLWFRSNFFFLWLMRPYSSDINFFSFLTPDKNSHIRSLGDSSQAEDLPCLAKSLVLVPSPSPSNINYIISEVRIHKNNLRGSFEGWLTVADGQAWTQSLVGSSQQPSIPCERGHEAKGLTHPSSLALRKQ